MSEQEDGKPQARHLSSVRLMRNCSFSNQSRSPRLSGVAMLLIPEDSRQQKSDALADDFSKSLPSPQLVLRRSVLTVHSHTYFSHTHTPEAAPGLVYIGQLQAWTT